jgi:hypothetical protein
MFCNFFWNLDCPLLSPLSGEPLKLYSSTVGCPVAELKEEFYSP